MERDANVQLLDRFWALMDDTKVEIKEKNTELISAQPTDKECEVDDNKELEEVKEPAEAPFEPDEAPGESFVEKEDENRELEDFLDSIIANRVGGVPETNGEEEKKAE